MVSFTLPSPLGQDRRMDGREKKSHPCRDPTPVIPVASHFTDWVTYLSGDSDESKININN
jgi:hypothetical protein